MECAVKRPEAFEGKGLSEHARHGRAAGPSISPCLASIYMRAFMVAWAVPAVAEALNACSVNYTDDFVICCRNTAEGGRAAVRPRQHIGVR